MTTKKPKPSKPRHDISRVRHITGRSGNISPDRLLVEQHIQAAGIEPVTQPTMVVGLNLSTEKIAGIMQRLRSDGLVIPVGRLGMNALYVWHTNTEAYRAKQGQPRTPAQSRPHPICNSNQPNGSQSYWAEHMRKMNTPARAEAAA